jgi:hypothetical protein
VALVWGILFYFLGGYEDFRYHQELITEIYSTTDAERMRADTDPQNYDEARTDLKKSLETKLRYDYTYLEFLASRFLCCCLCFRSRKCFKRRIKAHQRYQLALEQLNKETDFFSFLKLMRMSDFVSKVYMKEY